MLFSSAQNGLLAQGVVREKVVFMVFALAFANTVQQKQSNNIQERHLPDSD